MISPCWLRSANYFMCLVFNSPGSWNPFCKQSGRQLSFCCINCQEIDRHKRALVTGLDLANRTTAPNNRDSLGCMVYSRNMLMPVQYCSTATLFHKGDEIIGILQFLCSVKRIAENLFIERSGVPIGHSDWYGMVVECRNDHIFLLLFTFSVKR